MLVRFTINGKETQINENPNEKLAAVLRKQKLLSVKKGCAKGQCGSCTVLLDGKTIASCMIPVGILNSDSKIETLEYISKTEDYKFIIQGFNKAGIHLCGYCNASKILFTYEVLQKKLDKDEIEEYAENLLCNCTEQKSFIEGIKFAVSLKKLETEKASAPKKTSMFDAVRVFKL